MWQVRIWIWQCSNFEHLQQIRNSTNVLSALLLANLWKNPCSTTDFIRYAVQTDRKHRQTFFPKFNLSQKKLLLNVQHNFCSLICYTVLIWTPILLTLGNNIVTLLFNWCKPVHYIPSDKIMHSHSTNFGSQNSHSTNANFDQLCHITTFFDTWDITLCIIML